MPSFGLDSLSKTVSPPIPAISLRRSGPSAMLRGTQSAPASAVSSRPQSIVAESESDLTEVSRFSRWSSSLFSASSITASTSTSTRERFVQRQVLEEPSVDQIRLPAEFASSAFEDTHRRHSSSGIRWRYARPGAQLTTCAAEERLDADFERRSYIDGVAYFLKACPDNLTELETDIFLRSAPWLAERQWPERRMAMRRATDRGSSHLRVAVQYLTMIFVVIVHALWVAFLGLARVGAHYEEKYSISSQLLDRGSVVASAVGKQSVVLSGRISAMNEGMAGRVIGGFAAWALDSFTSGISDGFGDGVMAVKRRQQNQEVI